jgi:hypothetical protein
MKRYPFVPGAVGHHGLPSMRGHTSWEMPRSFDSCVRESLSLRRISQKERLAQRRALRT